MPEKGKKVRADYDYMRKHNDELSFNKGDIITITQQLDGGWWEGTLNGVTAWLPSNYVVELKPEDEVTYDDLPCESKRPDSESFLNFQNDILQQISEGESKYVREISSLVNTMVINLESMTNLPFMLKVHSLNEVLHRLISLHKAIINSLDEMKKSTDPKHVGKLFLGIAPNMSSLYTEYSSLHLFIVSGLEKYRTYIQPHFEARSIGFNLPKFKQQLSMPFERLAKYPLLLKEMERYIEESHIDRGDIQRAIVVFNELNDSCTNIRKMKERDLDILCASILGWKGERLNQLGDPVYTVRVGNVASSTGVDSLDHVIVIFPSCIILLACTEQADVYAFKSKISVDGLSVSVGEESNFELCSGLTGECLHVRCADESIRDKVVEIINTVAEQASEPPCAPRPTTNASSGSYSGLASPPIVGQLNEGGSVGSVNQSEGATSSTSSVGQSAACDCQMRQPRPRHDPLYSLRPDPPVLSTKEELARQGGRPHSPGHHRLQAGGRLARKKSEEVARRVEDDSLILQVIESYCANTRAKNSSKSLDLAKLRLSDAEVRRARPGMSGIGASHLSAVRDSSGSSSSADSAGIALQAKSVPLPPPPPPPTSIPGHQACPVHLACSCNLPVSSTANPSPQSKGIYVHGMQSVPVLSHQTAANGGSRGSVTASVVPPPVLLPTRAGRKL